MEEVESIVKTFKGDREFVITLIAILLSELVEEKIITPSQKSQASNYILKQSSDKL